MRRMDQGGPLSLVSGHRWSRWAQRPLVARCGARMGEGRCIERSLLVSRDRGVRVGAESTEVWGLAQRAVEEVLVGDFEATRAGGGWQHLHFVVSARKGQEWAVTSNRGVAAGDNSSGLAFSAREGWLQVETHFEGGRGCGGQWREKWGGGEWQIVRDGEGSEGQLRTVLRLGNPSPQL